MKIPNVYEALLDSETLSALLNDISARAELVEVMVRGAVKSRAVAVRPTLEEALQHLQSKTCQGVQLRYDHQGLSWWDTLIPTPAGTKLIRIAHDFEAMAQQGELS